MRAPGSVHFTDRELRQIAVDLDRIPSDANSTARHKLADYTQDANDPNAKAFTEPAK